ncbi:MAG: hypothetical protein Q8R44_20435 [Novosphingobium sp.]|nr:hypothetical protein [Novosphingobium sp.]
MNWFKPPLLMTLAISLFGSSPASACVVQSNREIKNMSDAIVEGVLYVDSAEQGRGHIVARRWMKGSRHKTYRLEWDPHPEETLQAHELDCVVSIPQSGSFGGFNLVREGGTYRIIGRWQRVQKAR